jgi:secretion/DNA translocation related TadE-like protein
VTCAAGRERGSASAYAVIAAAALLLVALVITEAAALVAVRHRAASAADLAALAGSQASVAGHDGCAAAERAARRNDARLVSCRMDFDVATVTARVDSSRWWGHRWAAEIPARAAPASYL